MVPFEFPIPRCDDALNDIGPSKYFILLDAYSGYHQIKLATLSQPKTAFYGTHACKYFYTVLPFGPKNGPAFFSSFIYDLALEWIANTSNQLTSQEHFGSKQIIDDVLLHALKLLIIKILLCETLKICHHYNLTLKLSKCKFFHSHTKFLGVNIYQHGLAPAQSKFNLLKDWHPPTTPSHLHSFLGFTGFYQKMDTLL